MSTTNPKGALNVVRRTWDTEEYAKRAEERENNEGVTEVKIEDELDAKLYRRADSGAAGPLNSKRAFLRARDFDVQVDSKLGKKKVVSGTNDAETSSYYCKLCECSLKDSLAWLDHINGKKHQRKLGYSMRIERSTPDQVKARLSALSKKKRQPVKPGTAKAKSLADYKKRLAEREKQREEEDRQRRRIKKKRRLAEEAKADKEEEEFTGGLDPEMAAMMGFSGFGGSSKS